MPAVRWLLPVLAVAAVACGESGDDRFELRTPRGSEPPPASAATGGGGGERSERSERSERRSGSGSSSRERAQQKRVTPGEERVIRGWSDAQRAGRYDEAARYFRVPVVVSNFTPLVRLNTVEAVRSFNESLSCGTRLLETERDGPSFVVATFRLTKGHGSVKCEGTGNTARTAFKIENGKITTWLRVVVRGAEDDSG
jgi:hypothetical protein